jgi:hypothetical protein
MRGPFIAVAAALEMAVCFGEEKRRWSSQSDASCFEKRQW